jgi:hypothetical protein
VGSPRCSAATCSFNDARRSSSSVTLPVLHGLSTLGRALLDS